MTHEWPDILILNHLPREPCTHWRFVACWQPMIQINCHGHVWTQWLMDLHEHESHLHTLHLLTAATSARKRNWVYIQCRNRFFGKTNADFSAFKGHSMVRCTLCGVARRLVRDKMADYRWRRTLGNAWIWLSSTRLSLYCHKVIERLKPMDIKRPQIRTKTPDFVSHYA